MRTPLATRYRDTYRRILIDMHVPDWDARFLADYDPADAVNRVAECGATGMMVYFQAHTGLCYWPTTTGVQHRAFHGRDPVAETLNAAAARGLPVCAYYSVNFNNWAYLNHPGWRLVPAADAMIGGGLLQRPRYGICCLNHPDYRQFVRNQIEEMVGGYEFDTLFCDMVWWMSPCQCEHCEARSLEDTGKPIPEIIDWLNPDWCRFQDARESWITELATDLRDTARHIRPDIEVYHNFALGLTNWTRGVSCTSTVGHDFLGGDFYGGPDEQLVISRLMLNLSAKRPVEFMTTIAANLAHHEELKSIDALTLQNLAASALGSAYLLIAAVDPQGTLNPAMLERCRQSFDEAGRYEPFVGGTPIEDVVVYFSDASRMSFADNGKRLADAPTGTPTQYPHLDAVKGACRKLQEAQVPYGVITRKQLDDLDRYSVIVLPNVLRMDKEEIDALSKYVAGGGSLYASGMTSLTDSIGQRYENFQLAEVFGCRYLGPETGPMVHLEPQDADCRAAMAGQRFVSHWVGTSTDPAVLRLDDDVSGSALMTLNLPYGYPSRGNVDMADWASIHSFPPWQETTHPVVVLNDRGAGRAIYSAATLETGTSEAHEGLFLHLLERLLRGRRSVSATAGSKVWMTVADQPDHRRWIVSFLHYTDERPPTAAGPIRFTLQPPAARQWTRLESLPDQVPIDMQLEDDRLTCSLESAGTFTMLAAYYEDN